MADTVGPLSNVIAVADLFIKVGVQCSVYCSGLKNAPRDVRLILNEADRFTATLKGLEKLLVNNFHGTKLSSLQHILGIVEESRLQLQDLAAKLERGTKLQKIMWPLRKEEVAGIIGRLEKYRAAIALDLQVDQTALLLNVHQDAVLAKLKSAKGAAFDSPGHVNSSRCYPGTREGILKHIQDWSTKQDGQCIFWLNGGAGTGKPTISRTVAQSFVDKGMLGASFFFKHGEADRGSMALFFPTIASQLVQMFPQVAPHIRAAIETDHTICERSIKEQFDKLIAEPIKTLSQGFQLPIIVIVADALDECDNVEHVRLVIHLLSQAKHSASVRLKFFVTSRPELAIRLGFANISGHYEDLILHQVPSIIVERDIALFLQHEFNVILQDYNKSVSSNRRLPLLWDIITGTCTSILEDDSKAIAFSNDSGMLMSASDDCIKIWDAKSGIYTSTLNDHSKGAFSVAFSHDSTTIMSVSHGSSLKLWDTATGDCKTTIKINNHAVRTTAFSHDSRMFALVSRFEEKCIRLLNTSNGECITTLKGHSGKIWPLCFSHNSRILTAGSSKGDIRLWEIATRTSITNFEGSAYPIRHIEFSHDSKLLVTSNGSIKIWDLEDNVNQIPLSNQILPSTENGGSIYDIKLVKGSKTLVSRLSDEIIQLWDISTFSHTTLTGCWGWPNSIAAARNAKLLATTSISNDRIQLWDISTGSKINTLEGHNSTILSVKPGGDTASAPLFFEQDGDRLIKVQVPNDTMYNLCAGDYSVISAIAFSIDSQLLASASAADGNIKVWDVGSNACIATLTDHSSWISQIVFLPSDVLASSSGDRTVKIWDIRTGLCTATFEGQSGDCNNSALSHDYSLLASGMDGGIIKIWDISTGECRIKLPGSKQISVQAVAFSHNSALLASIVWRPREGALKYMSRQALEFWNIPTGLRLATTDLISSTIDYISFDEVGSCLSTNIGKFIVKGTGPSHNAGRESLSLLPGDACVLRRGIGLSEDSEWDYVG